MRLSLCLLAVALAVPRHDRAGYQAKAPGITSHRNNMFNKLTANPTPRPSSAFKDFNKRDKEVGKMKFGVEVVGKMPTARPTSFPTKTPRLPGCKYGPQYELYTGMHCGGTEGGTWGTTIRRWADGSSANYGKNVMTTVAQCKRECDSHEECSGFVLRDSDQNCNFWKGGELKPFKHTGHHCFAKTVQKSKFVGWVGPGYGKNYCNIWKCMPGAKFKKTQRECRTIAREGESDCSDTKCKFDWTTKPTELLHYTFDKATRRFKNSLFNPKQLTSVHIVSMRVNRPWGWAWWSWLKHYYFIDITTLGKCELTRWKGNMAWHVVNNRLHSVTRSDGCMLKTKTAVTVPEDFAECKFSMLVRDVDYVGQRKEKDDFMCFAVTNKAGKRIAAATKCQNDDVSRRLDEEWFLGYRRFDATIHRFYTDNAVTLKSDWIPTSAFKGGFKVQIWAMSNHQFEHWYADDLKVTCRGKRVVKVASHHKEKKGGEHRCGYSKNTNACHCVCSGERRQDAKGFERGLNEISPEFNLANVMPKEIVMEFNFNHKGQFEGLMNHYIGRYVLKPWFCYGWGRSRRCFYYWSIEAIGSCLIEKYLDTTTAKYSTPGANMAWHVQNNAGIRGKQCVMRTKNAWVPPADEYHSCQFTFEVTDLDQGGQKERNDMICFKVIDTNKKVLQGTKEICQKDDISRGRIGKRTLRTPMVEIPAAGVNIEFRAVTNDKREHWYGDNLRIKCKKENDRRSSEWNAAYNGNNLYTKAANKQSNPENHHEYVRGKVGHYHREQNSKYSQDAETKTKKFYGQ